MSVRADSKALVTSWADFDPDEGIYYMRDADTGQVYGFTVELLREAVASADAVIRVRKLGFRMEPPR